MKTRKIIVAIATVLVLATVAFSLAASRASSPAAGEREVRLYGAGCPRSFTDFSDQKWCLADVSSSDEEIQFCSYNDCQ